MKKLKKRKKNLKGMTLLEMIISIFLFAVMCGLLVLVGNNIDATTRATNNLKDKVTKQSPYAANRQAQFRDSTGADVMLDTEDVSIVIKFDGTVGTGTDAVQPDVELTAKKYKTDKIVLDGRSTKSQDVILNGPNNGLNLEFIDNIENAHIDRAGTVTEITTSDTSTTTTTTTTTT